MKNLIKKSLLERVVKSFLLVSTILMVVVSVSCSKESKDLRVSVTHYSDKTGPYFEEAAKAFKDETGINVDVEVVSWDNMLQKLTTDISADKNADVAIIGTRWLLDFVDGDVVEPLDPYMDDSFKGRFIDAFLEPSVLDGKTYGLPIAASARAMFYNKALFKEAGVTSVPKTWDDLKEAAKKISKLNDKYGFGLQGKEVETDAYWYYALWSFGGDVITEDGMSGVNSDAAVEAAAFYKSLIDEKLTQPGVTEYSREDVQNLFKQGKLGMMITAPFLNNQIKDEAPDLDYGVAMIPSKETSATYGVTDSIVMFKNSKAKDEAFQFLSFIFQDEWRKKFTVGEGFLPVNRTVAEDSHFTDNENMKAFSEMLQFAKFAPTVLGWEEAAQETVNALQKIYLGGDPQTELDSAAGKINQVLGK